MPPRGDGAPDIAAAGRTGKASPLYPSRIRRSGGA